MNIEELTTPCFILDEKDFEKNLNMFQKILNQHFKNSIVGYSFKTNSLPRILSIVKKNGAYAEVVSDDEYELALKAGFETRNIIFNGPVKTKEAFIRAIEGNSIVNIDSKREIEWLSEINKSDVKVGIRVNFDLESSLPGHTSTGKMGGRFGFCYENGELHEAISRMKKISSVHIVGLHMHVSNGSKSEKVYECLTNMACKISKEEMLMLEYIDIGGGYFGGGDEGEHYEQYVKVIDDCLKQNQMNNLTIIVEPGASVIATAISYLTSVVDKKSTTYGNFITTDGTRLHIDPFMAKQKYVYEIKSNTDQVDDSQIICGFTCMEKDRIMEITNEKTLSVGDKILYKIVGSYSMTFSALFISYFPRVYSLLDQEYTLVRDKWTADEYIQKNRW